MGNTILNSQQAMNLADGEPPQRAHLDPTSIRTQMEAALERAHESLVLAYDLAYLEAKRHCDQFHEGKGRASDHGHTYGYINSFVRRDGGTNVMRFQYRRPTGSGFIERENIRMNANGYSGNAFKRAAHDYERELAMDAEKDYARLRDQGKEIKGMIRKLRKMLSTRLSIEQEQCPDHSH